MVKVYNSLFIYWLGCGNALSLGGAFSLDTYVTCQLSIDSYNY
ncbi:hypothetical protein SAMN05216294_3383 [Flagellimonas zhangzhouensis]|uniref:Uncharacterized protein n=1 Tax=Flagellimonas zhangzhouensis TaxID=1073328 RepID=A0A1H2ZA90_9FLAO|nr:hypothetical protein SAMN05216294_3383 [Allomuricauda zhangzhouensis]SDX14227.1 hypothetical protein SAMN04487892_3378 [Allomuricauda zhangzhouensis]